MKSIICTIFMATMFLVSVQHANAWILGIQFNLSDEQIDNLSINPEKSSSWGDKVYLMVHNGNEKITITEITFYFAGRNYKVDTNIPPYSATKVGVTLSFEKSKIGDSKGIVSARGKR